MVTATHRAERLQKIGATISALSGKQVEEQRLRTPSDLSAVTPALSTVNFTADGTSVFAIRGVGLDDFNPNNSSGTAVYIDDIYESSPVFLSGQLFDVKRVEVLEGPQGTLYGRNATGGAVNIVSNTPQDTPGGFLRVGYGRWDTDDVSGAVTGPITSNLSGRLAGTFTHQGEGYQTDISTGSHYGQTKQGALRAMLDYKASPNTTITLQLRYSRDKSVPASWQADDTDIPGCSVCDVALNTDTTSASRVKVGNLDLHRDEDTLGGTIGVLQQMTFADLTGTLGYDNIHRINVDNNDGVPAAVYNFFQNENVQQLYAEARLTSNRRLFGITDWIVGASYAYQDFAGHDSSDQSTAFIGDFENPPDLTSTGLSVAQANYHQRPSSFGVFAHTTTWLTSRLRLLLGGRFTDEHASASGVSTETGSDDGGVLFKGFGSVVATLNQTQPFQNFSYTAGAEYDFNRRTLGYATVATSTKSGAFYLGPAVDPAEWRYVKPERLLAVETGVKTSLFDRRLVMDVSAFYYDYKDRQSSILFISPITQSIVASLVNIPAAEVFGSEASMTVRPVRQFDMTGAVSYLYSEVNRTIDNVDGEPLVAALPVGTHLAQSPRLTYDVTGHYRQPLPGGARLGVELDWRWSDLEKTTIDDPLGQYGPDMQLNGRISLTKGPWDISFWGHNLLDTSEITAAVSSFVGQAIYRQRPVSYGLELTRSF